MPGVKKEGMLTRMRHSFFCIAIVPLLYLCYTFSDNSFCRRILPAA